MSTDLVKIPFHGGEVLTVDVDGKPFVVLKPVVESLGLAYQPQHKKLQGRSWATVTQRVTVGADGKSREMTVVDVRTLLMLLATINENIVAEHVRPLLVSYQSEVADAIESYWAEGVAINERSAEVAKPEIPATYLDALKALVVEVEEKERLQLVVEVQAPKIEYHDAVLTTDNGVNATVIAKDYGRGAAWLNELLKRYDVQYKSGDTWVLKYPYADRGYVVTSTFAYSDSSAAVSTKWTQAGRKFIYELLASNGIYPLRSTQRQLEA